MLSTGIAGADAEAEADGKPDIKIEAEGRAEDDDVGIIPLQNFLKNEAPSTTPWKLLLVDANVGIFLVVPFAKVTTVEDPCDMGAYWKPGGLALAAWPVDASGMTGNKLL